VDTAARRRTASWVALGVAVAVVAALATAAVAGQHDRPDPQAASRPPVTRVAGVPVDFPITAGLGPGAHGEVAVPADVLDPGFDGYVTTVQACGTVAWSTQGASSLALAAAGSHTRVLALYPDADAAADALGGVRQAVRRCDARRVPFGFLLPRPLAWSGGDASYAFVDPRDSVWVVVGVTRVGRALLVDQAPAERLPVASNADPLGTDGQARADQMQRDSISVLAAMKHL
jgi:hypothetical protein